MPACSDGPEAYFATPTYIDIDYHVSDWYEYPYGPKTMFSMVVRAYTTLGSTPASANDSSAREVSSREEPEWYAAYLRGAELFGNADYRGALKTFDSIRTEPSGAVMGKGNRVTSWVREASWYMVARCKLRLSQEQYDGYSSSIMVDQAMLHTADTSYLQYVQEYPKGLYANSARSIRRKVYFLSDQKMHLNDALRQVMGEQFPVTRVPDTNRSVYQGLIIEFENCFHGEIDIAHDVPILTAYAWLGGQVPYPGDMNALEMRKKDFAGYPGLFRFVRALGLYRMLRYQELLRKTPAEPPEKNVIWVSTQLLRVRALTATGNMKLALAALEEIHKVWSGDALDVEFGTLMLNRGQGLWLFKERSPIVSQKNLRAFATLGLTDRELEKGIVDSSILGDKRDVLVEELARRYILTGRFEKLHRLQEKEQLTELLPARASVAILATQPQNVEAMADLAEFLFSAFVTPSSSLEDYRIIYSVGYAFRGLLPNCVPCGKFEERTSAYTTPLSLFQKAATIARRSNQRSESEAKALHYIVMAGKPGHWMGQCTWNRKIGTDSTEIQGKRAFQRLHRLYKDSPWTAATPYYYR
ncbi:MAG: hypothetical protein WAU88_10565 [Candidatus Zixiibacteriota bacterium]